MNVLLYCYQGMSKNKGTDWDLLRRVLATARPFRLLFIKSVVLAIAVTPFTVVQPYIVQRMVDVNIVGGQRDGLLLTAIIFVVVLVISVILQYNFIYTTAKLGQLVIKELRIKVFNQITNLKLRYFDRTPIGTSTTRTINDIEAVNNVFAQGVITIAADIVTLIGVIGLMFYTSWRLTLIVFMTMPFMILSVYIFKEKVKVSFQKVRTQIAAMNAFLQERITGMKIIQIFNAEQKEAEKFRKINGLYTRANLDSVLYYSVFFPVVELISAFALALMIWYGAKGFLQDTVSFGAMVAFPLYLNMMFRPIRFMADKFNTLQMGLVAAERVFKVLDSTEFIPDNGQLRPTHFKGKIEFENVSFAYDDEHYVLHDLNFTVQPGETLALVGSTGSGKTTIISILDRFYDIQKGYIKIDGHDIKDYSLSALRGRIAIVLQDVFLFEGTVLENITLRDDSITREQVIAAAKMIGADDFISKLPDGYDSIVYERGNNLSVGQRQLISFVRALVFNPDILILDEATSSIDSETEAVIQYAIEKLIDKRTSIVIAHRLSTIQHAQQILVMSGGQIIERGNHEQLLENEKGHYRRLYDMQFSDMLSL
ncbi:MAG: xenobiotic-transporting ATPase [Bacteroidetes bacterium OLB9]|nr:MAG: xenobiotic-transporting ATPase [Bacteroidetes bacterium OLB9]MCZ2338293.1 ABC transporter ATP-binding protein/permease [Chitinophagales bacterium]